MFSKINILAGVGIAWASLAMPTAINAQEFQFSIHHFLSPKAPAQTVLLEPWVESIEAASNGRIKFEIFPSMTLGGAPPELYSQVRDGVADLVWTLPGYTPGVFPRLEVFELPGVHRGNATNTNLAIQDMMAGLMADLEDVHPILVHVHAGNALHLASGDVENVADFEGLKVRSPSRSGAWLLEELKAEPVGMPVPALPQALSRNTVDAGLVPYEIAIPLGLADLTEASVELHDGQRFGTSTFLFAMNKNAYNSLPEDLRQIIDDHSGMALAAEIGTAWDNIEPVGIRLAKEAGNRVTSLSAENSAQFNPVFDAVATRWVEETAASGFDGPALLAAASAAVAKHSAN